MKNFLKILSIVYTILFVLLPIPYLSMIKILPIGFPVLWCSLGIIYYFLECKAKNWNYIISCEKKLLLYILYVVVLSLLCLGIFDFKSIFIQIKPCISFILYVFNFYWFASKVINFDLAVKIYSYVCLAVSILLIVQVISAFLGYPFVPIPRNLMVYENIGITSDRIIAEQLLHLRFSAFF